MKPSSVEADRANGPRGRGRVAMVAYSEVVADPRILQEAEIIADAGWDVDIIGLRPRGPSPVAPARLRLYAVPLELRRGGRLRYLYQYTLFFVLSTVRLLLLHWNRRYDVVHVHSLPDFQVACAMPLRAFGVRVVLDLHESMPEILSARFHLHRRSFWVRAAVAAERMSCSVADRVLVSNPGIGRLVVSRGVDAARVTVLPNVAPARSPSDVDVAGGTDGAGGSRLIVHAGGLNPERDLLTLIRAAAIVSRTSPLRLILAGSGDPAYVEDLKRESEEVGLADSVEFMGQVSISDARRLMSLSSIGVVMLAANPLTEVAVPNRVLEFAGLGKPLVLPNLTLLRELFDGGAYFYAPGDPEDLALHMRQALSDNGEPRRRALVASRIIESSSRPRTAERLAGLYAGLRA